MVRIDGGSIRRLRESKGLTQLYLATVVGVTTDTISRWENRRYPTIKKENCLKLAEALEVELDAILECQAPEADPEPTPPPVAAPEMPALEKPLTHRRTGLYIAAAIGLLALAVILLPTAPPEKTEPPAPAPQPVMPVPISANRLLPKHVAPGQPFPVVITVETEQAAATSLILKETLPAGVLPVRSEPPYTYVNTETGELKWINRANNSRTIFAIILKAPADATAGTRLDFNGTVTRRNGSSRSVSVSGADTMLVSGHHWADTNADYRIEDEEILAAYDIFSALDALRYDWDAIDEIWSSSGYHWDRKSGKFLLDR